MATFGNRTLVVILLVAALTGGGAQAQFAFQKIADTNTVVPGDGTGTFSEFEDEAVIDSGQVAFTAHDANGDEGIYLFNGVTLSEVAIVGQIPPGLNAFIYTGMEEPSIEVTAGIATVGFQGFFPSGGIVLVTDTGGVATNRADDQTTLSPSTGMVFDIINQPGVSGGAVAFRGSAGDGGGNTVWGIYTDATGPLTTVVDTNSAVPGLPAFSFSDFAFDEDTAFNGNVGISTSIDDGNTSAEMLLIATPGGALTGVANTVNTLSPSTGVLFGGLNRPGIDGTHIAFIGTDVNGFRGVYADFGAGLITIVDEDTLVPGQGATAFDNFGSGSVAIDGDRIAFEGFFAGGTGLYLWDDGTLLRIIDTTQMLDGKGIVDLDFAYDSALSGDQVVFNVEFADASQGVFIATIPEPGSLALLGLGGLLIARRRRMNLSMNS